MLREHNCNILHTRGDDESISLSNYLKDIDITRPYESYLVVTDVVNYTKVNVLKVKCIDEVFNLPSEITKSLVPKLYRYYIVVLYTDNNTRDTLGPYSYKLIDGVDNL